ncbi:MAG: hypothetical protein J6W19_00425 [Prevotella sp.]|nr:hypothetical protein [Prevotella sp.]
MKKTYKQPMTIVLAVTPTHLMEPSIQTSGESASTNNGSYDKALSRRGGFWDDEEE